MNNAKDARKLREASVYLRSLSDDFWALVRTPKVSGEEMGRPLGLLADAGFDTPEMGSLVADWLADSADRLDATISATSARSTAPDSIAQHVLGSRDLNAKGWL